MANGEYNFLYELTLYILIPIAGGPERTKKASRGRLGAGARGGGVKTAKNGVLLGGVGVPKNAKKWRFWAKKGRKSVIFDHFGQKFF